MDQFNLLDLDNDVLNIIGDYVKKDNHERMEKIYKQCINYIVILKLLLHYQSNAEWTNPSCRST